MIDNLKSDMRPYSGPMICIDPGSAGAGIAVFNEKDKIPYIATSVLADAHSNWMRQSDQILSKLRIYIESIYDYSCIFIEEPQYFSSYVGETAAKSGSLAKLVFFYGRLWEICNSIGTPIAVPIQSWKGQLDKRQIINRIEKKIGIKYDSHAADAVGIGLYMRGIL